MKVFWGNLSTGVCYGILLFGVIMSLVMLIRTGHFISKYGYKKYILRCIGWELLLLVGEGIILCLLMFSPMLETSMYYSIGGPFVSLLVEGFTVGYYYCILFIIPLYIIVIGVVGMMKKSFKK